jgi:hypothetical protein
VGLRIGLYAEEKRKILHCRDSNPSRPARSPSLYRLSYPDSHLKGVLHKSLPSVCASVCVSILLLQSNGSVKCIPPFGARQRLGKHVSAATNTPNNRRIVGLIIFYAVRVLSKESLGVCLCIPLSLLGNKSVKIFPRQ